jgi:ABC-2 type transport system ATP-binding protein
MGSILQVDNLKKYFADVCAVDGISFSIEAGCCFGLLGPNGAGKTTTIEVIEGIIAPTSGQILYKGLPRGNRFRQEVGVQLQNTQIPQFLTVGETIATFRSLYGRKADLDSLIASCHLGNLLTRDNQKISGGQRQRLLLAIALANEPELIFLDEPTTGLDPQARRYLWDIVQRIKSENKTIVLTTHYMEEAQFLCDDIAIMDQGKIIAMGPPDNLLQKHCNGSTIFIGQPIEEALLDGLPGSWFRKHNMVEIQTENVNDCIPFLIDRGISLETMTVRSQNLEDLFLKLTGKQIRS